METFAERQAYRDKYDGINFKEHPEKYHSGRSEEGVLLTQPYTKHILPHWKFKTPGEARHSSNEIYAMFLQYVRQGDFVGADIARKFIQMGFTRAHRYANHSSGHKYIGAVPEDKKGISGAHGRKEAPKDHDPVKQESANIFKEKWKQARENKDYIALGEAFREKYKK